MYISVEDRIRERITQMKRSKAHLQRDEGAGGV